MNEVFGQYFVSKPARTSVQVAKLPVGCPLEMDVTALVSVLALEKRNKKTVRCVLDIRRNEHWQ